MPRGGLNRERVVQMASTIADTDGLDAVNLTRVAKELGTSQPALYRYVDSFEDLQRALGLRAREMLAARLSDAAIGVAGDDAIRALGYAWRAMVNEHPGLYAATDRYPCAGDAEAEAAVNNIVGILARSLSHYQLSEDDEVHAARSLRSAFHGFSHLESGDGHPHDQNLTDSFEGLLTVLCRGIGAIR